MDNQNTEEIPPPNADQPQANADQLPADDENQLLHEDDAEENNDDNDDDQSIRYAAHDPQHQNTPPEPSSSKPKNQAKTQNKHKRNSKCNKQNEKQSKPFSTDQTDKILEYSLYQGKPVTRSNSKVQLKLHGKTETKSQKP